MGVVQGGRHLLGSQPDTALGTHIWSTVTLLSQLVTRGPWDWGTRPVGGRPQYSTQQPGAVETPAVVMGAAELSLRTPGGWGRGWGWE